MRNYISISLFAALLLTACARTPQFEVSGQITGAEGETLFLEHTGLIATEVEDSCDLNADGTFVLHGAQPEYPDFYRLRIGRKYAVLVIDSTEKISLTTTLDSLPLTDAFIGSEQSVLVASLRRSLRENPVDTHRQFAEQLIMQYPASMAAYYAVFQSKQGVPVFDMYDKQQLTYYRVVATSMNVWMPDYVRTKTLYNQVTEAINADRRLQNELLLRQYIDESESSFLDIALPKCDIHATRDIKAPLRRMGAGRIFSPERADFSGIVDIEEPFWVDQIFHQARIRLDEEGTEAAAATVAVGAAGCAPPREQPRPFRADRPFLFALRVVGTGDVLFCGRVENPIG